MDESKNPPLETRECMEFSTLNASTLTIKRVCGEQKAGLIDTPVADMTPMAK